MADYTKGVNYAKKYSTLVDERFKLDAITSGIVNNNYDWVGVQTVAVYSLPTVAMNNYTKSGSARYGTASDLANSVQEMTVTMDRSFTFSIDRKDEQDTMGVQNAAKALRRQISEVVIPRLLGRRAAMCA